MNSNKVIPFNKGVNEEKSLLEQGASELSQCKNYELTDGIYAGLRVVDGYEPYDGTALPSETAVYKHSSTNQMILSGEDVSCESADILYPTWSGAYASCTALEDGYYFTAPEDGDANRIAATAAIDPPNATDAPVLAVFEYAGFTWAIKALGTDSNRHYLYRADPTGWTSIQEIDTATHLAVGTSTQQYMYYKGRLAEFNANEECMVFANGLSKPFMLHYSGGTTTLTMIDAGGFLPSDTLFSGTNSYPTIPAIWNQRVFLAYPDGNLFFNQPGADPTISAPAEDNSWDPLYASAGTIYFEDEITNLLVAPSGMVAFCEHMTKILKLTNVDPATGVDFVADTFSDRSGAIWNTARRVLGTIIFCDDRGVSTLETTAAYGDFSANVISKNIQNTYETNKDNIIGAMVNRERNQYKVAFNDGTGFIVTFKADKSLKGITTFDYPDVPYSFYECTWIGGLDGYVYKLHEGAESFNLAEIESSFRTSYFTYNTPDQFKQFKRMLFELNAERGTTISVRNIYDYGSGYTPSAYQESLDTSNFYNTAVWGDETWGYFVWGGTAQDRDFVYSFGIGVNMSIYVYSSSKYFSPHVIHNVMVSYSQRSTNF